MQSCPTIASHLTHLLDRIELALIRLQQNPLSLHFKTSLQLPYLGVTYPLTQCSTDTLKMLTAQLLVLEGQLPRLKELLPIPEPLASSYEGFAIAHWIDDIALVLAARRDRERLVALQALQRSCRQAQRLGCTQEELSALSRTAFLLELIPFP